jgi:hypothetical protein
VKLIVVFAVEVEDLIDIETEYRIDNATDLAPLSSVTSIRGYSGYLSIAT